MLSEQILIRENNVQFFNEEIIQQVRNYSRKLEETGKLSPEILTYIYEHQLFKLFLPKSLHGAEMPLPEALAIFEEAAKIDGSFGWLVTIGFGGNFFSAYLNENIAEMLFLPENAVVAGSGAITGTAVKQENGYIVNGQWQFCSGAHHATIFTANCKIEATKTEVEMVRSFVLLPDQVTIIEDWKTFGMQGTGSHSIKTENAFVPAERTFDLSQPPLLFPDYLLYKYPFWQFAEVSFAVVALGVGLHFLEEAFAALEQNRQRRQDPSTERYAFIREKFENAHDELLQARTAFYAAVNESWQEMETQQMLSEEMKKTVSKASKKVAKVARQAAHEMFPYLGMAAATQTSLLNQLFRDLHTVCQHTTLISYEE
ncbi:acyl-CoA dehydrogenase family protein [Adhaeribacter terreus]|uniref:Acyl-CoA dehydrogenase family protein n=1 Tax=Adhaeribacter terreus TaxID=529703 RepID=A0ABW0E7H3_9BACT